MRGLKIGLLPLYIKLYDDAWGYLRQRIEIFYEKIASAFEDRGVIVKCAPVCRLESEFIEAVNEFEEEKVDAIVTLHLAYSPSLMSVNVLSATNLPIVVLDTTETFAFGPQQDPEEILYNHGIHGVQDMCSMLFRKGKEYAIAAGHWKNSDVIERTIGYIKAAKAAQILRSIRVGSIGSSFEGMGDFMVDEHTLYEQLGISVIHYDPVYDSQYSEMITEDKIIEEMEEDRINFDDCDISDELHYRTAKTCLTVREWLDKEQLGAFTANFLDVHPSLGLEAMPFMEASKAMARGIGYAGEGDVLTAALIGSLLPSYPETSFIEIFCPDWEGDSLFISHMGEMNLRVADERPKMMEKDFPFTDIDNPIVTYARFKPGRATFVNLAPRGTHYTLIIASVTMLEAKGDRFNESIRGWMRPDKPLCTFMEELSIHGCTHHSGLIYGDVVKEMVYFGKLCGFEVVSL